MEEKRQPIELLSIEQLSIITMSQSRTLTIVYWTGGSYDNQTIKITFKMLSVET